MDPDTMLEVSTSDPTPPYEQLRRQLVELIAPGASRKANGFHLYANSPQTSAWQQEPSHAPTGSSRP